MDMSKLPRLSKTEAPPPPDPADALPAEPAQSTRIEYQSRVPQGPIDPGIGAQVWLSAIFGILCIYLGKSFGGYLVSRLTGQPFHTNVNWTSGPKAGSEVAYPELEGFAIWNDSAMFVFGIALLLEAAIVATIYTRFRFKKPLLALGLLVAAAATLFNLVVIFKLLSAQAGLPLWSMLAVAYGGFIVAYEWKMFRAVR